MPYLVHSKRPIRFDIYLSAVRSGRHSKWEQENRDPVWNFNRATMYLELEFWRQSSSFSNAGQITIGTWAIASELIWDWHRGFAGRHPKIAVWPQKWPRFLRGRTNIRVELCVLIGWVCLLWRNSSWNVSELGCLRYHSTDSTLHGLPLPM